MTGTPDPASGKVMNVAPCAVGLRPREQLEFRPTSVGAAQFALSPGMYRSWPKADPTERILHDGLGPQADAQLFG